MDNIVFMMPLVLLSPGGYCSVVSVGEAKGHLLATGSESQAEKELDQEEGPGRNIHAKHGSPMKERWPERSQKQGPSNQTCGDQRSWP